MNKAASKKLAMLRADYAAVTGQPFQHFYCPVVFRDEATPLSRAHVINTAFRDSERHWTIQRKDVDSFFGSFFESDFICLQDRGKHGPLEVLSDKRLTQRLRPKVVFKGKEVEYYYIPKGPVPKSHSLVIVELKERPTARLALKLDPSETLTGVDEDWEIRIEKDVRRAALVSLLKAAHLTLFDLIGYKYVLSAGGHFLGYEVLGKFFDANVGKERSAVLRNADTHFSQFVNLVRPIVSAAPDLKGTVSNRFLYLCTGTPRWAFLILIRTGERMHAVLAPLLEDADSAARFAAFLSNPAPRFEATLVRYDGERWEVSNQSHTFEWPAANFV
jgi:hypothetical protein